MMSASTFGRAVCGLLLALGCRSSSPQASRPAARAAASTAPAAPQPAAATAEPAAPNPEAAPAAPPSPPPEMGCASPCGTDSECVVAPAPDCGACVAVTIASAPIEHCAARACRASTCDASAHRARCDLSSHRCVLAPAS